MHTDLKTFFFALVHIHTLNFMYHNIIIPIEYSIENVHNILFVIIWNIYFSPNYHFTVETHYHCVSRVTVCDHIWPNFPIT